MALTVIIITPAGRLAPLRARQLTLPGVDGELGVRPGHAPMVCSLGCGLLRIRLLRGSEQLIALRAGVAEIHDDSVQVLAEEALVSAVIDPSGLAEQIRDLVAAQQVDQRELAAAGHRARWLATQLRAVGQRPPNLGRLALAGLQR